MTSWGRRGNSDFTALFGDTYAMEVTLEGEGQKKLDFLNKALFDSN